MIQQPKKYDVRMREKIIFWKEHLVATYVTGDTQPCFKVYDLNKETYSFSNPYQDNLKPSGQLWECFKSG